MLDRPVKIAIAVAIGAILGMLVATSSWAQAPADAPPEGRIERGMGIACNEAEQAQRVIRAARDLASANEEIKRQNAELGKAVCAVGGMAFVRGDKVAEERDSDGAAFDIVRLTLVAILVNGKWMPISPLVIYTVIDAARPVEKKV